MAIQHLTDEQIKTWSRRQKDEWWLANVFRGDMAQLTFRSGLTGFLLGGILSATALYIAARTGIGIGVNLTAVILAFAMFRIMASMGIAKDFTILENNCSQSIATSSGYLITPMISGLAAYMMMTDRVVPAWQQMVWMVVISVLGVLIAFPMKRRFINEDQLPFPEGRASGVVLDSLYTGHAAAGMFKARLLAVTAGITAVWQLLVSDGWARLIQFKILRLDQWAGLTEPFTIHERLDDYYYAAAARLHLAVPKILGTDVRQLGLRFVLDFSMLGVGGLMGIAVASSVALGAFVNYAILAPLMIQHGDIVPRVLASGAVQAINRSEISNQWSMWWGITMMVVGAFIGLLAKPEIFVQAFKSVTRKRGVAVDDGTDVLKDIEVPLWISWVGVPVFGAIGAWITHEFFGVPWLLAVVSLPLIIVLTVICVNSMALTSWAPVGPLAKITQFTIGAIDRTNPASNLLPASMTAEIASSAASMLSDIKPGYMLGAKPRHQVVGHIIGLVAGALFCVPLFFLLFLHPDASGAIHPANLASDKYPFPAAIQWKGVAEIIAKGFAGLPYTAIVAMSVAAALAAVFEIARIVTNGRFPLSAVSIGLGVVLPPESCFAMFLGALGFWFMRRVYRAPGTQGHEIWVEGFEPICAGLISGAALMGIADAIITVLLA